VLPVANDDDTVLEIAAMMAANRSPLVAVLDGKGKGAALLGAISLADLLGRVLPSADKG
jgi:CBS domain-containing protein